MEIKGSQKYLLHKMTKQDYRQGIVTLMCILEEHSKEFTTPEQRVSLIHEYSELITTIYSMDNPDDDTEDELDDDEDELDDDEFIGNTILFEIMSSIEDLDDAEDIEEMDGDSDD